MGGLCFDLYKMSGGSSAMTDPQLHQEVGDIVFDGLFRQKEVATSVLSATGVAPELLADLFGHVDTRMVFHHYRYPVTPTIDVAADHTERAIKA